MFDIQVEGEDRIRLIGRLDAAEADRALIVFRTFTRSVTADCAGLDYISSAGISVLMETWKRLNGAGQRLHLANMNARVKNVFVYAGLDKILGIE